MFWADIGQAAKAARNSAKLRKPCPAKKPRERQRVEPDGRAATAPPGCRRRAGLTIGPRGVTRTRSVTGRAALDGDDLLDDPAGDEGVALLDARAVGADLLEEQVGVVHQAGRQPPGGVAVVPREDDRAADEARPGDGSRRACAGGRDTSAAGRPASRCGSLARSGRPVAVREPGDDPVVRAAAEADPGEERREVRPQPDRPPRRPVADRRGDGVPGGVGRVERLQGLGAVGGAEP